MEQAIWGVANLTADDNQYRDLFIDANVIDDIVEASECFDSKVLRNICGMALSNLARGKPLPPTVNVLSGLLFLCKGLRNGYFTDEDTIKDALFALYYHFTPKKKNISLLIDSFVIPAIIEMGIKAVNVYDESYIVVITKLMGNIILGN